MSQAKHNNTIQQLKNIVGEQHVLTDDQHTRMYRQGRRFGESLS